MNDEHNGFSIKFLFVSFEIVSCTSGMILSHLLMIVMMIHVY